MKLVTWNVNSIRARLDRALAWLEKEAPDVLCIQETKCQEDVFPAEEFTDRGYHVVHRGQKTYNGVAILSREPARVICRDLPGDDEDAQARFLHAEVAGLRVMCAYVPNGREVGTEAFAYKLRWLDRLRCYLGDQADPSQPLALVGDFNIAPETRDVHDPDAYAGQLHFHPDEHARLADLCAWGLEDAFRLHHQDAGLYSWWDYRQLGFPKNRGLRIDLILLSASLVKACGDVRIDRDERKGKKPSDHAPVIAELDWNV